MPKHLVLFSDGTGNSSGKLFKTNVWRVYEAVDLADPQNPDEPRQFACYDDGVGTSSFKPLALLGGAFGVGLARNVLDLYVFLCRMYEPGDRIYAFGFSRGAFTIRVLIGLVMTQGLLCYQGSETDLQRLARDAYRAYRRTRCKSVNPLVGGLRNLRDAWLGVWNALCGRTPYGKAERIGQPLTTEEKKVDAEKRRKEIEISFVGLWDTVDAYGLPVDELTRAIDAVIWPLTMRDYDLSPRVLCARHALALDDERNAFHPRLWNERPDPRDPAIGVPGGNLATTRIADERISQVWFAGVHANVGGGYPDDSLAYVPLHWIMREANRQGLRFEKKVWEEQIALSDENGPIYDSRHGLGGYYRYNPRRIERLTNTPKVKIDRTKIHESVLRRIQVGHDGYAPIALPPGFAVVTIDGRIVDGDAYLRTLSRRRQAGPPGRGRSMLALALQLGATRARSPLARALWQGAAAFVERATHAALPCTAPGAEQRVGAPTADGAPAERPSVPLVGKGTPYADRREHVYNWVWRRRVAYFATLGVTLALLAMPLAAPGTGACKGALCWLAAPIAALEHVLPSFAAAWTRSFSSHPDVGLSLLVALGFGLWRGGVLERRVRDEMRRVWYALSMFRPGSVTWVPAPAAPGVVLRAIQRLRSHPAYRIAFRALTHGVLPMGFLGVLAFGVVALGSQVWFAMRASAGTLCRADGAAPAQAVGVGVVSVFDTRSPCTPTGLTAVEGATYRVRITVPAGLRWIDGATSDAPIPAGPNGFECRLPASTAVRMAAGVPLRRHLVESWFQPMVRIGATGNDTYALRGKPRTATPQDRCDQPPPPAPAGCPATLPGPSAGDEVFESDFVARSSGPVFLYVNDAVDVPFLGNFFHTNNRGCGRVVVTRIGPPS